MLPKPSDHDWRLPLSSIVIGLICLGTWALSHGYRGIFHDAPLYTLQALSHLHPATLTRDVFLRFGSQDDFTIFSFIYARFTQLLGVETAAAVLTLTAQMALIGSAWYLARAVLPAGAALLGLAVVIAIPGDYGPERILTCIEPYLTPRMAAEALTLVALAAALNDRRPLAIASIVVAALFHPLMAAAGMCAILLLWVCKPWPRSTVIMIFAGLLAMTAQSLFAPVGPWGRFDDTWLAWVDARSPFLFLSHWHVEDWSVAGVSLATLAVGVRALPDIRARTLCVIVLLTVLAGLMLSFIGADLLHLVIVTQLQTWRWLWAATLVAGLLIPQTVLSLWARDGAGRTTAMLLLAAWLFAWNPCALMSAVAAVVSSWFTHRLKPNEARWLMWGAGVLLAGAIVWRLASNLEFTELHYLDVQTPLWLRKLTDFAHDGSTPIAMISLAWWLSRRPRWRPALIAVGAAAVAGCLALLPSTWKAWTTQEFSTAQIARFAPLRALIPRGSEVFWPESPVGAWVLLDSPSYISVIQSAGMVFSRQSAQEFSRRAATLSAVIPAGTFTQWQYLSLPALDDGQLMRACATQEFEFMVTRVDLGVPNMGMVSTRSNRGLPGNLRLYRCRPPRA